MTTQSIGKRLLSCPDIIQKCSNMQGIKILPGTGCILTVGHYNFRLYILYYLILIIINDITVITCVQGSFLTIKYDSPAPSVYQTAVAAPSLPYRIHSRTWRSLTRPFGPPSPGG